MTAPYFNQRRYVETEGLTSVGVEGFFIGRAIKPGFGVTREFGISPNLITNLGLNALGSNNAEFTRMLLGTGTAAPAFTDTALTNFGVNVVNSDPSITRSIQSSSPYYVEIKSTWTSSVGGATGTWTEIGISKQNTNGNLRSHALILDGGGSPTSFPVLSDEQFQGVYIFRFYMPVVDNPASINLSGTPYSTTTRSLSVTSLNQTAGWWPTLVSPFLARLDGTAVYTGGLSAITATSPGGSYLGTPGLGGITTAAYTNDNFYRDSSYRWGSGTGVGTVRTLMCQTGCGQFQVEYNPSFTKLTTEEFIHNQRFAWARR